MSRRGLRSFGGGSNCCSLYRGGFIAANASAAMSMPRSSASYLASHKRAVCAFSSATKIASCSTPISRINSARRSASAGGSVVSGIDVLLSSDGDFIDGRVAGVGPAHVAILVGPPRDRLQRLDHQRLD